MYGTCCVEYMLQIASNLAINHALSIGNGVTGWRIDYGNDYK